MSRKDIYLRKNKANIEMLKDLKNKYNPELLTFTDYKKKINNVWYHCVIIQTIPDNWKLIDEIIEQIENYHSN